jgi:hypothetical protein
VSGAPAPSRRVAFLVAAAAFAVYNANGRVITEGDSIPARYLPFAILRSGSLTLESLGEAPLRHPKNPPYWVFRTPSGRVLSPYPIVTPVLLTPLYVPAALGLSVTGWRQDALERTAVVMEKISASLVCAVSVELMYLLLARRLPRGRALLLTAAYALGTSTWPIGSQALWQHGTAQLLLAAALVLLDGPPRTASLVGAGAALGLVVANRPPDVFLAVGLLAFLVIKVRGRSIPALGAAAAAVLPFLAYNVTYFGNAAGGYGVMGLAGSHPFYDHAIGAGLAGLLLCPAKGLFVFSPFLLFLGGWAFPGVRRGLAREERLRLSCLGAGCAAFILFYSRTDWRGGACYGPRFLSDALPFLTLLLVPVASSLSRAGLRVFATAIALSIFAQGVGALVYPKGGSDEPFYPADLPRLTIAPAVWSPRLCPILVEARAALR